MTAKRAKSKTPAAKNQAKAPPATTKPAATRVAKPPPKDEPEAPTSEAKVSEAKVNAPLPTGLGVPQQRGFDGATLTRIWVAAATVTIALTVILGTIYGPPTGVLVLVTATFTAVIALFWSSLRTVLGETVLQSADAFAIGAPHGEDEQKRAVLRALKDLEFERSVGKISEDDYKVLVAKLRARAKELLRQLDAAGSEQRARAEKLVEERARALLAAVKAQDEELPRQREDSKDEDSEEEEDGEDEVAAKPAIDDAQKPDAKDDENENDAKDDENENDAKDEKRDDDDAKDDENDDDDAKDDDDDAKDEKRDVRKGDRS